VSATEPTPKGSGYKMPEVEQLLDRVTDLIDQARPMPLSTSAMINKDEILDLLVEVRSRLPEELRASRWLLKEREEFLARMQHEGDEILEQARDRAERMVQRTEVVKASEQRAYQILDTAEAEARRLRHEVEDFCDQKLASFEIVLDRTMKLVASGRQKLQGTNLVSEGDEEHPLDLPPPPDAVAPEVIEGFYDEAGYDDEFYDQDDAS